MTHYRRSTRLDATSETLFAWHARPGAFARLAPPWTPTRVVARTGAPLEPGSRVTLELRVGPVRRRWVAEHGPWQPGRMFSDRQLSGPFAAWEHHHRFEPAGRGQADLVDEVRYRLPFGWLGAVGAGYARGEIERLFAYRHRVTARDVACHATYGGRVMKVAVTGASGLIGSALVPFLEGGGHTVVPLARATAGAGAAPSWDPATGALSPGVAEGLDAVVHLAGENIAGGRWTETRNARIRDSRVDGTQRLAEALARLPRPPSTLVVSSAIGFYGDRGDERVDESSAPGTGFLPDVCEAWEAAATPARDAGIRVVHLRTGIVLTPAGGALAQMLLPFKMGVGGVLGSGRQFMSWIALDDVVGSVLHALATDSLAGPVNVVAPAAATNAEFTKALGRVLRRPTVLPMPAFAVRLLFGEMGDALLLASANVVPTRLAESGYRFGYPTLEAALRHVLGRAD